METLEITPGWGVELESPGCELKFEKCNNECTHAVRVHGCILHYSCESCARKFVRRVAYGFRTFKTMRCSSCGKKFSLNKKEYYEVIKL